MMSGHYDSLSLLWHCKVLLKNTAIPPGAEDFSTKPEELDLACAKRTRTTFACELGGLGSDGCPFRYGLFHKILTGLLPLFKEKMLSLH